MTNRENGRDMFSEFKEHHDDQEKLKWRGNFEEYLGMAIDDPYISRLSASTVYDALTSRPDFFTTGEYALFGAEKTIKAYTDILKAGAEGRALGKRIILLLGPPGSGKSTLANGTKRAIEDYSKTDAGKMYAIVDCPVNEDPLHLVPEAMRASLEQDYGLHIEGSLCQVCLAKYGGDNFDLETLRTAPVKRLILSRQEGVGVATFEPRDPKSQDDTELVGTVNFSTIGEFGTSSDARAFSFDGAFHRASRGMMEFVEILKSDERFLYHLLNLTEDRTIKSPKFPPMYVDEVIIAHTNIAEYDRYMNNDKNEAMRDRIFVIEDPYTLEASKERMIHEKLIGQSRKGRYPGAHVNPLSLDLAATFSVLTRIQPSKKYNKIQKLRVYDGKNSGNLTWHDAPEMHEEFPREGMSGLSPRFIIDSLSMALTHQDQEGGCLTPMDTYHALLEGLESHAYTRDMDPTQKLAIKQDLETAKKLFDEDAMRVVQEAFLSSYGEAAQSLADNYVDNVEAFMGGTKLKDPFSGEDVPANEKLMRSIEERAHITEPGKKEFRSALLRHVLTQLRHGGKFDYSTYPVLKEAIEQKLFSESKDMIKMTISAVVPNEKQQRRIDDVMATLIEQKGYCEHCASKLIRYVGPLLNSEG